MRWPIWSVLRRRARSTLQASSIRKVLTNICERVVFEVTGRMEEINVSKY